MDDKERRAAYRVAHREEHKAYMRAYYVSHREKFQRTSRERREADPERKRIESRLFYATHREQERERSRNRNRLNRAKERERLKKWRADRPDLNRAAKARRRASEQNAMPEWTDQEAIREIYAEAADRNLTVDHIVPLNHPLVCGLHVPWNLQLLSGAENSRKGNRLPPDIAIALERAAGAPQAQGKAA